MWQCKKHGKKYYPSCFTCSTIRRLNLLIKGKLVEWTEPEKKVLLVCDSNESQETMQKQIEAANNQRNFAETKLAKCNYSLRKCV